jgi:hypothetical protein
LEYLQDVDAEVARKRVHPQLKPHADSVTQPCSPPHKRSKYILSPMFFMALHAEGIAVSKWSREFNFVDLRTKT